MADKKISQLTEKTGLVDNDVITILDSEASFVNKKAKVGSLRQGVVVDPSSTSATLDIYPNKLYWFYQPLTSLTISNIEFDGETSETEIQFRTSSTFTFTATGLVGKWLGVDAPSFETNSAYVIAFKNGFAACAKVGA